jgi:hypothetical protein
VSPPGTTSFSDQVPHTGNFYYQVTAAYNQGESAPSNEVSKVVTEIRTEGNGELIPTNFALWQNFPNPFNPVTSIRYTVGVVSDQSPAASRVRLTVHDLLGREVAILVDEERQPGNYQVKFDGSGLSSGVYFYKMQAGGFVATRKLLLLR